MPKNRSDARNRIEAGLVRLLLTAAGRGTAEGAEAAGRRIGRLYRRLDGRRRHLVARNLERAFPEKTPGEIEALSRAVFEHFGGVAADVLRSVREPSDCLLSRIELSGVEGARAAADSGRGVVYLAAHLGNWEFSALAAAAAGLPAAVVARPLDNPLLEGLLRRYRERTGNTVVYKRDAAREILRHLRRGDGVGILVDQHARPPDAIVVPFFGRPASTSSALARIVDRTEALVVPSVCFRTGPARYRLEYGTPLDVRTLSAGEREVESLTARLNLEVETLVRRHPEQWLWLHNRWRLD